MMLINNYDWLLYIHFIIAGMFLIGLSINDILTSSSYQECIQANTYTWPNLYTHKTVLLHADIKFYTSDGALHEAWMQMHMQCKVQTI